MATWSSEEVIESSGFVTVLRYSQVVHLDVPKKNGFGRDFFGFTEEDDVFAIESGIVVFSKFHTSDGYFVYCFEIKTNFLNDWEVPASNIDHRTSFNEVLDVQEKQTFWKQDTMDFFPGFDVQCLVVSAWKVHPTSVVFVQLSAEGMRVGQTLTVVFGYVVVTHAISVDRTCCDNIERLVFEWQSCRVTDHCSGVHCCPLWFDLYANCCKRIRRCG